MSLVFRYYVLLYRNYYRQYQIRTGTCYSCRADCRKPAGIRYEQFNYNHIPNVYEKKINSGMFAEVLNGFCCLGGTISSYGLGIIADNFGWTSVFLFLMEFCALVCIIWCGYVFYRRILKEIHKYRTVCKQKHHNILRCFSLGGESGIRTHGTLPYDGFQDRSVITTSVSLHIR